MIDEEGIRSNVINLTILDPQVDEFPFCYLFAMAYNKIKIGLDNFWFDNSWNGQKLTNLRKGMINLLRKSLGAIMKRSEATLKISRVDSLYQTPLTVFLK